MTKEQLRMRVFMRIEFEGLKSKAYESCLKVCTYLQTKFEGRYESSLEVVPNRVRKSARTCEPSLKVDMNRVWKSEVVPNRVRRAEFGMEVVALVGHRIPQLWNCEHSH